MEGDARGEEGKVPNRTQSTEDETSPAAGHATGQAETQHGGDARDQGARTEDDLAQELDDELDTQDVGQHALPLKAMVESLLFVADEPVHPGRLAAALEADLAEVEAILAELAREYAAGRGIRLQSTREHVQMVTAPEATEAVRRFLGLELDGRLSPAALEALAIVAYRQPATRAQVEAIRGVNSDSVLRTLINRGLIEEMGRLEQAGRPIIYGTSFEFLQQFGLTSLEELPYLDLEAATDTE